MEITSIGVNVTDLEPTGVNSTGDYTCPDDPNTVADGRKATFREIQGTITVAGARPTRLQLTGCGDEATALTVYAELVP